MANMEHVQIVKRGRDAVARWREENPDQPLDLNASYMSYAKLAQVDLSGCDLRDSDLMGAGLQRANLSGCYLNPCHLYRANMVQADLSQALLNGANMRGANLTGANLSRADLDRVILSDANLTGANLRDANLSRANLAGTNLTDADLTGANLNRATLNRANLTNTKLQGADFYEAILNSPILNGADFSGCIVGYTVFQNCDLSVAQGLDQIRHDAPSTIGIDVLYRSGGGVPDVFLRNAGLPESICEFQRTLKEADSPPGDCFISCSAQDADFAQTLRAALQEQGVPCWVYAEDTRGNPLVQRHSTSDQEEVERGVRAYDKLVVVCTQQAMDSETVRNDIIQAQQLQESRDGWVLYLVATDDTVISGRGRLARTLSTEHVVFDLRTLASDPQSSREELSRLAEGLKTSQPKAAGVPKADFQL
ncbi:MAG: toll/interleukin-1 receptor domain-containing protein [Chloroflexi bacterium]|nr:toll/interleukin-1 receptor domain-containing protein [Chloroflexota bacterium]